MQNIILPNALQLERIIQLLGGDKDVYGIEWNRKTNEFKRIGATSRSDFDKIYPWAGMRRCTIQDNGQITSYHGDPNYTQDGSIGQVMVEIPLFYYQSYRVPEGYVKLISPNPKVGFKPSPSHVIDGKVVPFIYVSAYEGSVQKQNGTYLLQDEQTADFNLDRLSSIVGAKPASGETQNLTIINTRKLANNRGVGWQQLDVLSLFAIQDLMIIEAGTTNVQSVFGNGICNLASGTGNHAQNTGATAHLGNSSGQVTIEPLQNGATGASSVNAFSYRGIENIYGNIWSWIDGLNIKADNIPFINFKNEDYQSDFFNTPYTELGVVLPNANGYGSDIVHNQNLDFGLLPTEVKGASNNGLFSYYWQSTGNRVARFGSNWADSSAIVGVACWNLSLSSAIRYRNIGGRLRYVKK